ncbi:MAG: hypothetical protein JWR51_445 [Devosia sp.]|uniref:hypothetical protein n=1 Tax=Devosia sp. TaxID=1871048 RepID=UPI0026102A3C|nr:hypothetical protein [Devosia sp.]MDB5527342.1 hypothetical protein [Devosia sp.]
MQTIDSYSDHWPGGRLAGVEQQWSRGDFLEAARINHPKAGGKVFTVGPYGHRVGFAFQQARAFMLAAAFADEFDNMNPSLTRASAPLAVLGGGVAGITMTAALHSLGFTNLTLFERKANVLMDQAYASHRIVHPAYNTWPLTHEFASTTRFPFLNWFAGPCDKVVKALRAEWESEWLGRLQTNTVRSGTIVKKVVRETSGDRIEVHYTQHPRHPKRETFDYVFVTLGFGSEKGVALSDNTSGRYWNVDTIRQVAEDHEKPSLLCVGDGDGALIDCARMAYRCNVFDLATRLMAKLSSDGDRPPDHRDWKRRKTAKEQEICDAENRASDRGVSPEKGAELLDEFYRGFVKRLSPDESKILEDFRIKPEGFFSKRELHLVARGKSPFRPGNAPINKLIVAYLLEKKSVIYHRGDFVEATKTAPAKLVVPSGCPQFNDFDYRVVRIGADPPAEMLFRGIKKTHNTALHLKVTDYHPGAIAPDEFLRGLNQEDFQKQKPGTLHHTEKMKPMIGQFLGTYCKDPKGGPAARVSYGKYQGGGLIVVEQHQDLTRAANKVGGFDWQLFGIPIVSEDINRKAERENPTFDPSVQGNGR